MRLQDKLEQQGNKVRTVEEENSRLKSDLSNTKTIIDNKIEEISLLKENLIKEKIAHEEQIEELNKRIEQLELGKKELRSVFHKDALETNEMQQDYQFKIEDLGKQITTPQEKISYLKKSNEILEGNERIKGKEIEKNRKDFEILNQEYEQTKMKLEKEGKRFDTKINELSQQIIGLESEIESLKNNDENLQSDEETLKNDDNLAQDEGNDEILPRERLNLGHEPANALTNEPNEVVT